jgi:hypothetical protein
MTVPLKSQLNEIVAVDFSMQKLVVEHFKGMTAEEIAEDIFKGMTAEEDMPMPEPFRKFYARGDRLREEFGRWHPCDPTAQAILNLVAAQNSIAQAIDRCSVYPLEDDSEFEAFADFEAALAARRKAVADLVRALEVCPRAFHGDPPEELRGVPPTTKGH